MGKELPAGYITNQGGPRARSRHHYATHGRKILNNAQSNYDCSGTIDLVAVAVPGLLGPDGAH